MPPRVCWREPWLDCERVISASLPLGAWDKINLRSLWLPHERKAVAREKTLKLIKTFHAIFFLHVSCVGASCSSVLQVSKIKTSCWSYERSIKVNVPQEIGRGTKSLRCPGPLSYLYIPCELVSSWRWFCYPGLQLSILFPSRWQSMQIKDIGSKSRTRCFQLWPIQGSGHGLWCTSR